MEMNKLEYKEKFKSEFLTFLIKEINILDELQDNTKNWSVKGFIDIKKQIYEIDTDTKIISKILELQILPFIKQFCKKYGFELEIADTQNKYPDFTLIDKKNNIKIALDLKTTYKEKGKPKGFTLGSHGTYFKNRKSIKNIMYPYNEYVAHFVLGILYERVNKQNTGIYKLENLEKIKSSIRDVEIFLCEKWQIASDKQGSSNTANIGSITDIEKLRNCKGVFTIFGEEGEEIFDDYWINYGEIINPKTNKKILSLDEFLEYKNRKDLLQKLRNYKGEK